MKKIMLILTLLISVFTFAQTEALTTWENCAIEGDWITDELMSNNPEVYEQILVLVIDKSKKLSYKPSSSWIHREINRQCFAIKSIGQWIGLVGGVESTGYQKRIDPIMHNHMVFITQYNQLRTDYGSLYKAEFLPEE